MDENEIRKMIERASAQALREEHSHAQSKSALRMAAEALDAVAAAALSDSDRSSASLAAAFLRLLHEHEEAIDALDELYGLQNGPPLSKYEEAWNTAMEKAAVLLRANGRLGPERPSAAEDVPTS